MTTFIIVVAVLLVTALILVVPPLLSRGGRERDELERRQLNLAIHREALDELEQQRAQGTIGDEDYAQAKLELEQRLLEEVADETEPADAVPAPARSGRLAAGVAVILIPLLTIGLYLRLGSPEAIDPSLAGDDRQTSVAGMPMADRINAMVARLAARLERNPDDADGWVMLGRSYIVLERFADARAALEKAAALKQDDPQLLADLADALAMTSNQSLAGRPSELIAEALRLDPDNQKALWLAGTAAYEQADYARALDFWRRLYVKLPPGSETARTMAGNIAEAEALLEGREPPSVGAMGGETAASGDGTGGTARLTGRVRLADSLRDRVSADDTVFVFAKAPSGPPMPLAVQRARVRDLPLDFVLDETMAMTPQMSLARFSEVVVVARVSKSGNAMPRSGDLQGRSGVVAVGGEVPEIVIDEVVP